MNQILKDKPTVPIKLWGGPVSIRGHGMKTYEGKDGHWYSHDLATDLWYMDTGMPHKPILEFNGGDE